MVFRERLLALVIDVFVFVFSLIISIAPSLYDDYFWLTQDLPRIYYRIMAWLLLAVIIMFVCRDCIGGQSIGKRIVKIKVVNTKLQKPNFFQLVLRNIPLYLWPVETMLLLLGKQRLGDRLAKTQVVSSVSMQTTQEDDSLVSSPD